MNENRKLIVKLIPYINASNPIRRKGIINMIRNIREPELESHFYRVLHALGLPVKVESNQRWT